ncbi:hypothetical protein ECTW09195_2649 [Escherichia coli TW09195]|nr:hypothetical protein ECPA14_2656 [Escherichia coli PA14]EIO97905.1 hypothetical protein ECTW09195_2649 [Escherichia coli TW09195]EKK72529.1 hypothetical protein EC880221_2524 [Escherichia coli 88.0221]ERE31456.1 hypothetical protein S1K_2209 [Escherichia coli B89]
MDFPQPDGPINVTMSPLSTVKLTFVSKQLSGKRSETFFTQSISGVLV